MRGSFIPLRESRRIYEEWKRGQIAELEKTFLIRDEEETDLGIERVTIEGSHLLLHLTEDREQVHYRIPIFKGEEGEPSDELQVLLGEDVKKATNTERLVQLLIGKKIPKGN